MANNNFKKAMVFLGGFVMASAMYAQQETAIEHDSQSSFSKNVYVSAGIGNQWLLTGNASGRTFVGRIAVGSWFNNYSGMRVRFDGGLRKTFDLFSVRNYAVGADYLLNLVPLMGGDEPSNRFSLTAGVGASYNFTNYEKENGKKAKEPSANISLQCGYDFSPHWGVYSEFAGSFMKKFYEGSGISSAFDISVGLKYHFSARNHTVAKSNNYAPAGEHINYSGQINALTQEVNRLNEEVNNLRSRVSKQASEGNKNVILAPKEVASSIDVFFDKFSSYINDSQKKKINSVGEWMKNNSFDIRIVAFSDNLENKDVDEKLRKSRTDAIRDLLVKEYGIRPERISVVRAEDLGYKNLTGCNAKIIFVEAAR